MTTDTDDEYADTVTRLMAESASAAIKAFFLDFADRMTGLGLSPDGIHDCGVDASALIGREDKTASPMVMQLHIRLTRDPSVLHPMLEEALSLLKKPTAH